MPSHRPERRVEKGQNVADRRRETLSVLACPVCHGRLAQKPEVMVCTGCERRYPVMDGLLVLLASAAEQK